MSAPVKHTCPDIDRAIKQVNSAIKSAYDGQKRHEKRTDDWYDYHEIVSDLEGLEGALEDLRSANTFLREWGEGLTDELESSANYINELETKLEQLNQPA